MKAIHFEVIDSTNTYLKNNYQSLDNFTFVSADYQISGKGRHSRIWKSEDGKNLLFSLLLKDEKLVNRFKELSILSAYSVLKVLESYGINNVSIKWPNDVYVNDKKICGILLEGVSSTKLDCLIIGIGLNVNQMEFEKHRQTATSVALELNKQVDINELKDKVYKELEKNILSYENFYEKIIQYNYLKNKVVYASINNIQKKVKVIDINLDYSLKIEVDNEIIDIESDEISFHIE